MLIGAPGGNFAPFLPRLQLDADAGFGQHRHQVAHVLRITAKSGG